VNVKIKVVDIDVVIHDETLARSIKQNTQERGKGSAKREDLGPS